MGIVKKDCQGRVELPLTFRSLGACNSDKGKTCTVEWIHTTQINSSNSNATERFVGHYVVRNNGRR